MLLRVPHPFYVRAPGSFRSAAFAVAPVSPVRGARRVKKVAILVFTGAPPFAFCAKGGVQAPGKVPRGTKEISPARNRGPPTRAALARVGVVEALGVRDERSGSPVAGSPTRASRARVFARKKEVARVGVAVGATHVRVLMSPRSAKKIARKDLTSKQPVG